ncbi:toxin co-regulated pilus biosynthesis Q family protein [Paraglaciecola sp. L3A3]|uniref:toxin co-regulated pilus biosynthesis Q family protein n=1 Tax=Paraglaciecola sp. L3A3 TaxID=2686358 RepID=UPI00131DFF8F|nr:toxin co-regulated pilus biosynthesis Q family protein [Paraglaciecola sp. L3A3]
MVNKKKSADSIFWLKHTLLGILILLIAGIVLYLHDSSTANQRPDGEGPRTIEENMSNFYSDYKLTSRNPREEGLGDFVLPVKKSEEPLNERLKKMESLQKPESGRWEGEHKHRSFKSGSTLRSAITDYAESEGMQVIWELDQDFIIKHTFQLDDSILGSLSMIAKAIDANFDGEVKAYMCPRQRSLVITVKETDYLNKHCTRARN